MRFYLGVPEPSWLARSEIPLFVSAVRLRRVRRKFPRARCRWALDSGGFSEISAHGTWTIAPEQYAAEVTRWQELIGNLDWAVIQDWMCEPHMLAKTGKTVREHQELTIESLLRLRQIAPSVPWVPVVQGWTVDEYLRCVDMYLDAGVDLRDEPVVGVGSVCRRQGTLEGDRIMRAVAARGIRVHAFGVKRDGLHLFGSEIASSDSMAWSFVARRRKIRLPRCEHKNTCQNCYRFAMHWYWDLLAKLGDG